MRASLILALAAGLAGCQSLTPAQQVQLACIGAATGAAVAKDITKGGAHATSKAASSAVADACAGAGEAAQAVSAK